MTSDTYLVPAEMCRTEITVANSRFITSIARVESVEEAKGFLSAVRAEMPDASHHVYAYRIGYGNSVIEGMSDDGEPSGTAGPPALAVLRGTSIGDIIVVVTRYFGGTKLGTGGLVRAYSEATRVGLNTLKTEEKIEKALIGFEIPYSLYEQVKRLIVAHDGVIDDETFAAEITLLTTFPKRSIPDFQQAVTELSSGQVELIHLNGD